MKNGHIFIQCASYRDPELGHTIKSALTNADHPDTISFGICWQGNINGKERLAELDRDLYLNGVKNCRIVLIHKDVSKGIGYARQKAQMMFEGEEYTLQIDSHMRFMPSWDTMCIEMLNSCSSPRPLLTAYLTDYATGEAPGCYRLAAEEIDEYGNVTVIGHNLISANKPQLGILASGHFVFVKSRFFTKVPVDPNMQFLYEETLIAPRAWTNGWDIYYPHQAPLQHKWNRSYRSTNWNDLDTKPQERRCRELYQRIVGIKPIDPNYAARYGMGTARSLEDYQAFSGIDFKNKTLTQNAKMGFPAQ